MFLVFVSLRSYISEALNPAFNSNLDLVCGLISGSEISPCHYVIACCLQEPQDGPEVHALNRLLAKVVETEAGFLLIRVDILTRD